MNTVNFKCPKTQRLYIKCPKMQRLFIKYNNEPSLWNTDFPLYEAELNLDDNLLKIYSIQTSTLNVETPELNPEDVYELIIAVFKIKFLGNNKMTISHYKGTLKATIEEMSNMNIDLLRSAELEEIYSDVAGDYRNIYRVMYLFKYDAEAPRLPLKAGYDDDKYLLDFLEDYEEYFNKDIKTIKIENLDEDNIYRSRISAYIDGIAYPYHYVHLVDYHGEEEALEIYTLVDFGQTTRRSYKIGPVTEIYGIKRRILLDNGKVIVESREFKTTLYSESGVRFRGLILERDNFRIGLKDDMQEDEYTVDEFIQLISINSPFSITDNNIETIIRDYINFKTKTSISNNNNNTTPPSKIRGF